jgi:hypothetical protein
MLMLTKADGNAATECKNKGRIATWGQGNYGPPSWIDASCINPELKGVKMVSLMAASRQSL